MQLIGAFRLGRDAELRHTPNGNAVCNLALAANYGRRDEDGNRRTQWVDAALWGKRAEALAQYLLKGQQVYAVLQDPHIETYEGKNGTGSKLVADVLDLELVGGRPASEGAPAARAPAPQRNEYAAAKQRPEPPAKPAAKPNARPAGPSGFDDMDDDIPF